MLQAPYGGVRLTARILPLDLSPPSDFSSVYNRGLQFRQQGNNAEALASFNHALALQPQNADARYQRGIVQAALQRPEAALADFDRALSAGPPHPELLCHRAIVLIVLGRPEEAVPSLEQAVTLNPDYPEGWANRAFALWRLGRLEEALASFDRALALRPDYPEALHNRGNVFGLAGRLEEALADFDKSIALAPGLIPALTSRAKLNLAWQRNEEALKDFDRIIALDPHHAVAHWEGALCSLAIGDFARGWRDYEWRWSIGGDKPDKRAFVEPLWLGDTDLTGKTILLHAEQGYGDTLQFCRYVPLVAQRCRVILEVPGVLVRVLSTLDQGGQLFALDDKLPPFDVHCPLGSLPYAFRTTMATIPAPVPYLKAQPEQAAFWRQRLSALPGLRVGLTWAGRLKPYDRSIPANELTPLGAIPGVSLVSLQKREDDTASAMPPEGMVLHDWAEELRDFADTAALIDGLDLVITIDTAVAHLAGAMGKPVWVLNRFDGCWRWFLDREDSPWYPTLRLFRQPWPGDWRTPVEQLTAALTALAQAPA